MQSTVVVAAIEIASGQREVLSRIVNRCDAGKWQRRQALAQAVMSLESPFQTYLEGMRRRKEGHLVCKLKRKLEREKRRHEERRRRRKLKARQARKLVADRVEDEQKRVLEARRVEAVRMEAEQRKNWRLRRPRGRELTRRRELEVAAARAAAAVAAASRS
jgi:hypothetical protein